MKSRSENFRDARTDCGHSHFLARHRLGRLALCLGFCGCGLVSAADVGEVAAAARLSNQKPTMRIGAAQPRSRLIDYRLTNSAEVLAQVDRSLGELEQIAHHAGAAKCDALAFPEDTLGLGHWEAAHKPALKDVLPDAVRHMLDRLGRAAASHQMYLVCCNDTIDPDGPVRNTAFLLGRDGQQIGRYHKVNLPISPLASNPTATTGATLRRARGTSTPIGPR